MSNIKVECPRCKDKKRYEPTGNEACDDKVEFTCDACGLEFNGQIIITMEIKT